MIFQQNFALADIFVQIMHICNHGHNKWVGLIGVGGDLGYRGYRASPKLVENPKKEPLLRGDGCTAPRYPGRLASADSWLGFGRHVSVPSEK